MVRNGGRPATTFGLEKWVGGRRPFPKGGGGLEAGGGGILPKRLTFRFKSSRVFDRLFAKRRKLGRFF
jgi:hypothetical protein